MVKLNKSFRAKWLAALRSGKYKQGKEFLANYDSKTRVTKYCCLGVAAKVCRLPNYEMDGLETPCDLNEASILPENMKPFIGKDGGFTDFTDELIDMNDSGTKFNKIADYIEKHTVGV